MKPPSMFEQREIKQQYTLFQLVDCCFSACQKEFSFFFCKFLASLASQFVVSPRVGLPGTLLLSHSPSCGLGRVSPKIRLAGEGRRKQQGPKEPWRAGSAPASQRGFRTSQNFPLEKMKWNWFVRPQLCTQLPIQSSLSPKKLSHFRENSSLFGIEAYEKTALIRNFSFPLQEAHLLKIPSILKLIHEIFLPINFTDQVYCRFDYAAISLLCPEANSRIEMVEEKGGDVKGKQRTRGLKWGLSYSYT